MPPVRSQRAKIAILGAIAISLVSACGTASTPSPAASSNASPGTNASPGSNASPSASVNLAADQTLRFPLLGEIDTLDPAVTGAETDTELAQNLYDSLLKLDNDLNVVPNIAASMPTVSPDGLTYTFPLRKDVTFWNGDKVTSKDVLYSWNRGAALHGGSAYFLSPIVGYDSVAKATATGDALEKLLEAKDPSVWMTGLTAPDDYTVKVQLGYPAAWFIPALASPAEVTGIVDENAVKQDFDNWWANPATAVGTGAYKLVARTPNQSMDFEAVPNWWGSPKPTVTKIHVDILPDAATAIAKYEQGSYDLYGFGGYSSAPLADLLRIKATPDEAAQLQIKPNVRTTWVNFNLTVDATRTGTSPFTLADGQAAHDLRLAFDLAVDKDALAKVVCGDGLLCVPATGGLISPGLVGNLGDGGDPLAKFDPAQAKALLKSADPDGSKTANIVYTYDTDNNPLFVQSATFLQDQWQTNLGVHVTLQAVTHSTFMGARANGQYGLSRGGWLADYNSPQDWYDGGFGSNAGCPDGGACASGYTSTEFDTLADQANALPTDQAVPVYKQMAQKLIDDVAYIPLMYHNSAVLVKPYVSGAAKNAFYDYYWNYYQILAH